MSKNRKPSRSAVSAQARKMPRGVGALAVWRAAQDALYLSSPKRFQSVISPRSSRAHAGAH